MKILLVLLINFSFIGWSQEADKECYCKSRIRHDVKGEDNIPLATFLTNDNAMTLQIAFEDKDEGVDSDYIHVKRKSYEIARKRSKKGLHKEDPVELPAPMPLGWVNMNITLNKFGIVIAPYFDNITTEFPMREIIIGTKYMSSCSQGTPSWKIVRDKSITVPISGLNRSRISIISTKDFSPIIYITGNKFHFTLGLQEIVGTSGLKLPGNEYHLIIENSNDTIYLAHQRQKGEDDVELLASVKFSTILTNLTAATLDEEFTLILEPKMEHASYEPILNALKMNVEAPSCTVWQVTTSLGFVIAAISILICIYMTQKLKGYKNSLPHTNSLDSERRMLQGNGSMEGSPNQCRDADEEKKGRSTLRKAKVKETPSSTSYQHRQVEGELRKRNRTKYEELYGAALSGDLTMVKEAIRKGADLNSKGNDDATPLHAACWEGHLSIVQELLQTGAYIDNKTSIGMTPLHAATDGGHLSIVKELLKEGANVNACDNYGNTPLSIARREVHPDVEQLLKEAGSIS